jgi:hypothetical protein
MNNFPTCLTPISATNLPAPTAKPALSVLECQLGPAFANMNGVHNLNLNGKSGLFSAFIKNILFCKITSKKNLYY